MSNLPYTPDVVSLNQAGRFCVKAAAAASAAAVMLVAGTSTSHAQTAGRQSADTNYHVVKSGDTLWDLSGRFYGDTYQWPRMWSYNAHITNPHWIYPGDIVYLKAKKQGPQPGQRTDAANQGGQQTARRGMYLPLGGFIASDEVAYVGRITASRKAASMLGEFDTAWVGFGDDAYTDHDIEETDADDRYEVRNPEDVRKGDKFAVVRELHDRDEQPEDGDARKYVVLGAVEVTKTNKDHFDEVEVTQSWREMTRGDMLIPYERQLKVVAPTKAADDHVATIVDSLQPGSVFGEHHYLFIDKGAADGVRTGNRLFAYQRYEGLHEGLSEEPLDDRIPWTRIGQVMVVDVREHHSTVVVTDSRRELVIGDRLEMYGGH